MQLHGNINATSAVVDLPFVFQFSASSAGSSTFGADTSFRLNDAYNPASGTHQPYSWDTYANIYRQYKVLSTRFEITALPNSNTSSVCLAYRVLPPSYTSSFSGSTMSEVLERPGVKFHWLNSGGGKPPVFREFVNMHDQIGVTKSQYDADVSQYSAATTSSPSRIVSLQVASASPAASSTYVIVKIVQRIHFWQRNTLAQS
jgi:hypothetical protein